MHRSSVLLALVTLLSLTACMSIVGGPEGISPSQFHFQPTVLLTQHGPGGWKSARLVITLLHVTEKGVQRNVRCPIEVQVPEVNRLGVVTDELAQLEAARAADVAAERALRSGGLSAEMCNHFRGEMQQLMGVSIPGTRVIKAL